jgi:DNA repair protein RadD
MTMSSPPVLRPYQVDDVEKIRDAYRKGFKAPLYCAPCGSGKTRIFSHICSGAARRGTQVLILAHRTELVDQISTALTDEGCAHGFIAADYPWENGYHVYVASVFTLAKRLACFRPDLIIVDEAHHAIQRTTWGRILQAYPHARILGVTATPQRLSGEPLALFDTLIVGPTHEELIRQGYLTPVRVYAPPTIDTDGLHSRYGDFVGSECEERATRPTVTGDCIEHYQRHTPHARALVFDVSVDAARRRALAFREAGFSAEVIEGETPRDVRALAIAGFRTGRIQVLTSCELVSEGFDLPAIEVGICLRPTQSLALWLQQSGRVLRPYEGKTAAVLFDHAGNTLRHGLPTETRAWTLSGVAQNPDRSQPRRSLRTCPACFAVSPQGAVVCRACGKTFPVEPRKIREEDGELAEVTAEALIKARKRQEQGSAKTLEALIQLGRTRGMRRPDLWARHVMKARIRKGRLKGARL